MESLTADPVKIWTFVIVGLSFALYIGIAWRAKAETTSDFYVAGSLSLIHISEPTRPY